MNDGSYSHHSELLPTFDWSGFELSMNIAQIFQVFAPCAFTSQGTKSLSFISGHPAATFLTCLDLYVFTDISMEDLPTHSNDKVFKLNRVGIPNSYFSHVTHRKIDFLPARSFQITSSNPLPFFQHHPILAHGPITIFRLVLSSTQQPGQQGQHRADK